MSEPERTMPETLAETEAAIEEVEHEIAVMQAKMDHASAHRHATGEWSDPGWWARIKARKRFTGQHHQRLLRHAAKLRKAARKGTLEGAFVDAARRILTGETFQDIMAEARAAFRE